MADEEFPSLEGVAPKTWRDYDPSKLGHVERFMSGPVHAPSLRKGDVLLATEEGCVDLVEVVHNNVNTKKLYLVYHTNFGQPVPNPQPFVYDCGLSSAERAYIGQHLRIFERGDIPGRYAGQVAKLEGFLATA